MSSPALFSLAWLPFATSYWADLFPALFLLSFCNSLCLHESSHYDPGAESRICRYVERLASMLLSSCHAQDLPSVSLRPVPLDCVPWLVIVWVALKPVLRHGLHPLRWGVLKVLPLGYHRCVDRPALLKLIHQQAPPCVSPSSICS